MKSIILFLMFGLFAVVGYSYESPRIEQSIDEIAVSVNSDTVEVINCDVVQESFTPLLLYEVEKSETSILVTASLRAQVFNSSFIRNEDKYPCWTSKV